MASRSGLPAIRLAASDASMRVTVERATFVLPIVSSVLVIRKNLFSEVVLSSFSGWHPVGLKSLDASKVLHCKLIFHGDASVPCPVTVTETGDIIPFNSDAMSAAVSVSVISPVATSR